MSLQPEPGPPVPNAAAAPEPAAPVDAGTGHLPRYGLLLCAAIALIAIQGVVAPSDTQQIIVAGLAGATLLLAVRAAQLRPVVVRFALLAALGVLGVAVVRVAGAGVGDGAARAMNGALLAVGPPAVAIGVVRDLRTTGRVRLEAIMGVLSLYLLLGLFFAFTYGAIDRIGDDQLFADEPVATVSVCIYYSFVTLTTVGFGDYVTVTDLGHTLSVFEALLGQIYLVTVVSLMVGNLGRTHVRAARR